MSRYSVIFFDLDNTLLDFHRSENKAIRAVLQKHGLPSDEQTAQLYSKINLSYWEAFERGDINREDIFVNRFKTLLERLDRCGNAEAISVDYFHELANGHDLVDGAVDILEWLKQKGILLYATTNGVTLTQYRRIEDAGINHYFNGVFVSEKLGVQKPSRAYFNSVIAAIPKVDKKEILVVGDSQTSDILGGINAGLDTCWFNPKGVEGAYTPTYTIKELDELKKII